MSALLQTSGPLARHGGGARGGHETHDDRAERTGRTDRTGRTHIADTTASDVINTSPCTAPHIAPHIASHAAPHAAAHTAPADAPLAALLHAVCGRCGIAFAQLYQLTSPRLFALTLRIVGHHGEAEEVLQDVYLKVWQRASQYNPSQGPAMHWLIGIARHHAIDHLRRRKTQPQETAGTRIDADAVDPYASTVCSAPQPLDQLIAQQTTAAVRDCWCGLSTPQRDMLALAYIDGLSHPQIASRLQRPLGSVKSVLRRSLLQMRPTLTPYG